MSLRCSTHPTYSQVGQDNLIDSSTDRQNGSPWRRYAWLMILCWTAVAAGSLAWNLLREDQDMREIALSEARAHFNLDQSIRTWVASHGGIYVPSNERTPPNPHLAHLPDRDITKPSGERLTLMNPAYATRQLNETILDLHGVAGHITSLKPLRPQNKPDDWERSALIEFEQGKAEKREFATVDGQPHLRFMRPMLTKKSCLKCHGAQGYQVGDIRGGVSVSIPMAPLLAVGRKHKTTVAMGHAMLWLLGITGIVLATRRLSQAMAQNEAARAALQKSEHLYRQLVEGTDNLVTRVDNKGTFSFVNHAGETVYGIPSDECIGLSALDFIHPEDRQRTQEWFERCVRDRIGSASIENRQVGRTGEIRDMIWTCHFKFDPSGQLVETDAIARNITELKKAEKELHLHREHLEELVRQRTVELEEGNQDLQAEVVERKRAEGALHESLTRYRSLVDTIPHGIEEVDLTGVITFNNAAHDRIYGYPEGELIGKTIFDVIAPGTPKDELGDYLAHLVEEQPKPTPYFAICRTKAGREIEVQVDWNYKRDSQGQLTGFISVITDVTERKRAQRALWKAERMRGEAKKLAATGRLAAQVAHEINNPLGGIKNAFLLIKDAVPPDHPNFEFVGRIDKEMDRIARIVRQMYQLHLPHAKADCKVDVPGVVRDVTAMLQAKSDQHDVRLETAVKQPKITLVAPAGALQQILYNLIANAIEASAPGSAVRINASSSSFASDADVLKVTVSDQGGGIPAETQARIFEPFFTTKTGNGNGNGQGGLGLGLSVAQEMAHAMDGSLECQSEPGQGTTFQLLLPLPYRQEAVVSG